MEETTTTRRGAMNNWMHIALVGVLLMSVAQGRAQNLVPNPSFEIQDSCPDDFSQIAAAPPWSTFRGSADVYHSCNVNGTVDVPSNGVGFQLAAEGQAYAGLITYLNGDPLHREFMGAPLLTPLVIGVPTYVSMWIAVGGFGPDFATPAYSVSGYGLFFTTSAFVQVNSVDPLPTWAAVEATMAPTDTSIWLLLDGTFVPDSAYAYVVVGNRLGNQQLNVVEIDPGSGSPLGYIYVDQICVSQQQGTCPLALNVHARGWGNASPLFPNPCTTQVDVHVPGCSSASLAYSLVDAFGRVMIRGTCRLTEGRVTMPTTEWPEGSFTLVLYDKNIPVFRGVLVHLTP